MLHIFGEYPVSSDIAQKIELGGRGTGATAPVPLPPPLARTPMFSTMTLMHFGRTSSP